MTCFVCGKDLEAVGRVSVTGHVCASRQDPTIRMHPRCATYLLETVLASYHASLLPSRQLLRATPAESFGLTPTEHRILERVVAGKSNAQIARELGLAQKTVKNKVSIILDKLEVSSRTEATTLALTTGLVEASRCSEGAPPLGA